MNKPFLSPRFLLILSLIAAGAMFRLVPHWPNFTPVAAIALFSGTYLKRKELAFLVPVATMLISDLVIGFHNVMIPVYISMLLTVVMGQYLQKRISPVNVVGSSILSSLVFFLITNFASWATGMMPYSSGPEGVLQAYIAGLPFFMNGIIGDLFFNTVLFGGFYLVTHRIKAFAE